ncbi:uncharacterized protein LOC106473172 isoform X2 [Limulus polyphemus]|uniref:Uncharacterized protein LOC106473172 isoform X2 n=1 Tax=Limulus polyphemus TaxID=6850 RepID=A0ABM1TR58_LIMPO|nr:uncharacterized protein LOC106473172 isoform X2 [Limulus polyphemus]
MLEESLELVSTKVGMSDKENHKQQKWDTKRIRNIKTKSKNSEFPHNSPYLQSKRKAEKNEFSVIHGRSENESSSLDDQTLSPYPELLKSPVLSPEVQQMLKDLGVTLNPVEESRLSYLSTNRKLSPLFQNISKKFQDTTNSASTLKSLNLHSFIESSTPNYPSDNNSSYQQSFEREKFRRQHCEKVIEDLQHELLERDQNIAVLEAESKKKDEALQELQVTFQKVCEAWENVALPNVEKLREVTEERDNLINQLQSVEQIVENLKTELDTKENELKSSLNKEGELKVEIKNLINQNRELSEQLQQEKSQSMKFEEKVKDMNSEIQSLQTHLTREQEETLIRESEMDKKLVELKQMKVRSQQLITELQNKLITVQELYHNAEQKSRLLTNEKMNLEEQLTESEAKRLSQEASSLATLEHKINKLQTEANRKHEEQVRGLEIQHKKEKDSLVESYEEQLQLAYQSHQKEIDELKRELNQKIIDKNSELMIVFEEVQRLRHSLERLETSRSQILSRLQALLQFHWLEALDLLYGSSSTVSEKEDKNSWTELDRTSNIETETKKTDINPSYLWSNDVSQNLVKTLFKTSENLNDSHHLKEKLHNKCQSESNDTLSHPYKSDIAGLRDLYWYPVTEDIQPIQNSVSMANNVTHPNKKHPNIADNVQTVFSSNEGTCSLTGFDMSKDLKLIVPQKLERSLNRDTIPNELLDIRRDFLETRSLHELPNAKEYVESTNCEVINRDCTEDLDITNHTSAKLDIISAVKLNPLTGVSWENQTFMTPRISEQPMYYNICSINHSLFPKADFSNNSQLLDTQVIHPVVSKDSSTFQPVSSDYSSMVHSVTSNCNNNTTIQPVTSNYNTTVQPVTSIIHNTTVLPLTSHHSSIFQPVLSNLINRNQPVTSSSSFLNNIALPLTSNQTLDFDVQPVFSHVIKPVELKTDLKNLTQLLQLGRDPGDKQKPYNYNNNNATEVIEPKFSKSCYSTAFNSCPSNTLSPHLDNINSAYLVASDSDHNKIVSSLASNSVLASSVQSADSNLTNTVCSVTSRSNLTNSSQSVTSRPDFTNSIQSAESCSVSNRTSTILNNGCHPSNMIDSDIKDDLTDKTTETFEDWLSSKENFKNNGTHSEYSTSTTSQQSREAILNQYVLKVLQQTPKSHQ